MVNEESNLQNDTYNMVSLKYKQKQKFEVIIGMSVCMFIIYISKCAQMHRESSGEGLRLGVGGS